MESSVIACFIKLEQYLNIKKYNELTLTNSGISPVYNICSKTDWRKSDIKDTPGYNIKNNNNFGLNIFG